MDHAGSSTQTPTSPPPCACRTMTASRAGAEIPCVLSQVFALLAIAHPARYRASAVVTPLCWRWRVDLCPAGFMLLLRVSVASSAASTFVNAWCPPSGLASSMCLPRRRYTVTHRRGHLGPDPAQRVLLLHNLLQFLIRSAATRPHRPNGARPGGGLASPVPPRAGNCRLPPPDRPISMR